MCVKVRVQKKKFATVTSHKPKKSDDAFACDFKDCNYVSDTVKALTMHKVKCHKIKVKYVRKSSCNSDLAFEQLSDLDNKNNNGKVKEQCKLCKKFFANLANHKKCLKRSTLLIEGSAQKNSDALSHMDIPLENYYSPLNINVKEVHTSYQQESSNDSGNYNSDNKSSKKMQCSDCKTLFKNLDAHEKCLKRKAISSDEPSLHKIDTNTMSLKDYLQKL